jgi:hypothetical protein
MSPELVALLFVLVVFAGVFIVYMGLRQHSHQLELRHKERMALIERGLLPAAEPPHGRGPGGRGVAQSRSMSLGITVVALGLGLMTIVSIAGGVPEVGVGVGGGIAILGAAFIVNSLVARSNAPADAPVLPSRDDEG